MRKAVTIGILLVFVVLLSLRFIQLDADPPMMLAEFGQSTLTDPYLYTWHARQATLFPPDQQIEYERFAPLKFTAVSAVARVVFAVAGVSRVTANIASILLCLGGMLLWLLALRKFWNNFRVTFIGILLLSNFVLIAYGRMPYLENGLIFFFGLTFFIHSQWGERPYGQVLTGVSIAAAALCGKLFGVLLIVPVVATQVYFLRARSIKPVSLTILGGVLGFAAYLFICLGGDFDLWWRYHVDTTDLLHVSKYFIDPLGVIGMFLSFGGEGGLTRFAIGSICIAAVGSIVWLISRDLGKLSRDQLPILFSIVWLALAIPVFLPFEYRPLRYFIVGVVPAITLVVPLIESWSRRLPILLRPPWLVALLVFVITLLLTNQIISYFANLARVFIGLRTVLPYCLIAAGLVTMIILWARWRKSFAIPISFSRALIVIFVGGYFVTNGRDIYTALSEPRHDLKTLNREVSEIIDSSAIVTGSYGPALTIDNNLNGVFNYLGSVRHDPTFFITYRPTHLLTNLGDLGELQKDYPSLAGAGVITKPILWSYQLQVVTLASRGYHRSLFEKTYSAAVSGHLDSAQALLDEFDRLHPANRLSAAFRVNLYIDLYHGRDSALFLVGRLSREYPEDYYILAFAADAYQFLNRPQESRDCLDRRNRLNPYLKPR
jgi:hypothetical protein